MSKAELENFTSRINKIYKKSTGNIQDLVESIKPNLGELHNEAYDKCMDSVLNQKQVGSNDGLKNDFYAIPVWVVDCDTLAEYLELDGYEFNVLKTLWIHKGKRHDGTNDKREVNKRIHYAKRSKEKLERNK